MATHAAEHTARESILTAGTMSAINAIELLPSDHRQV